MAMVVQGKFFLIRSVQIFMRRIYLCIDYLRINLKGENDVYFVVFLCHSDGFVQGYSVCSFNPSGMPTFVPKL